MLPPNTKYNLTFFYFIPSQRSSPITSMSLTYLKSTQLSRSLLHSMGFDTGLASIPCCLPPLPRPLAGQEWAHCSDCNPANFKSTSTDLRLLIGQSLGINKNLRGIIIYHLQFQDRVTSFHWSSNDCRPSEPRHSSGLGYFPRSFQLPFPVALRGVQSPTHSDGYTPSLPIEKQVLTSLNSTHLCSL